MFITVLEAGNSRIKESDQRSILFLVRILLAFRCASSCCVLTWQKEIISPDSSHKDINLILEDSTLMTYSPTEGSSSRYHYVGTKASTYEFWKDTNIQSIVHSISS